MSERESVEHESDPDRPERRWMIPARIRGRIRTSTVALGICFVLTALLYGQVRPDPPGTVSPTPETTAPEDVRTPESVITQTPLSVTPSVEESPDAGTESGESGFSPTESGTVPSEEPTLLPGVPIPPQLRSVIPTQPSAAATS